MSQLSNRKKKFFSTTKLNQKKEKKIKKNFFVLKTRKIKKKELPLGSGKSRFSKNQKFGYL